MMNHHPMRGAGLACLLACVLAFPAQAQNDKMTPIAIPAQPDAIVLGIGAPPLFVALAADDPFFANAGVKLIDDWRAARRPVEFHLFEQGGHGFGMS